MVLRKGSRYRPGTFFNEGKKKFTFPAKPGVHPFGLGDSLIGVSSNWGSLNGGIPDGGSSIGSGPCIVKICQHLTKEVSICKMLAYYAGILCWHLPNRNLFCKMLAYYAGIICQHIPLARGWVARSRVFVFLDRDFYIYIFLEARLGKNYWKLGGRTGFPMDGKLENCPNLVLEAILLFTWEDFVSHG